MKRGWFIILLLSLGLNVGLGLNVFRRPSSPPKPLPKDAPRSEQGFAGREDARAFVRHRLDRLTQELDLTQDQQDQLLAIHLDAGDKIRKGRMAKVEAREKLHEAYTAEEPNICQIHMIQREMSAIQTEMDSTIVDIIFKERDILTAEQRQKYRAMFPGERKAPGSGRRDGHGRHSRSPRRSE